MKFIEAMPERIQAVLAARTGVSLDVLSSLAYDILSLVPLTPNFAPVNAGQHSRGRSAVR